MTAISAGLDSGHKLDLCLLGIDVRAGLKDIGGVRAAVATGGRLRVGMHVEVGGARSGLPRDL